MTNEDNEELIRDIERNYGWVSDARPKYLDRSERLLVQEGETRAQRELAYRVVNGLEQAYDVTNRPPLINPDLVIEAFESHKSGTIDVLRKNKPNTALPDFSLGDVLGEVQRRIDWFKQVKGHDETSINDRQIDNLTALRGQVNQAINLKQTPQPPKP